tara:strand:+ start:247 stop:918 length:672 start_codon:yes stop_codon:yes gene_type:complete
VEIFSLKTGFTACVSGVSCYFPKSWQVMKVLFPLLLGGVLLCVGCGSSESAGVATKGPVGPTAEEILAEQKKIAEYYQLSYRGKYVVNRESGKVEQLFLMGAPLTDLGADRIAKLKDLHSLNLVSTKITDAGLAYLSELPNLRKLELGKNKGITDAGIDHLLKIKSLEVVHLSYTSISDKGLMKMAEMPNLKSLIVSRTKVSQRGRDKFERTPTGRRPGFDLR